jgi:hypothetical protein
MRVGSSPTFRTEVKPRNAGISGLFRAPGAPIPHKSPQTFDAQRLAAWLIAAATVNKPSKIPAPQIARNARRRENVVVRPERAAHPFTWAIIQVPTAIAQTPTQASKITSANRLVPQLVELALYRVEIVIKQISVGVQSHRRGCVAEHPLHCFHVRARRNGE